MISVSNKQDVIGMQGLFNSTRVNKKKNLEMAFRGTAKIAKMDLKMQELRRQMAELESGSEDENDSRSSKKSKTSYSTIQSSSDKSTKKSRNKKLAESISQAIVIPQEFKQLQSQMQRSPNSSLDGRQYSGTLNMSQIQKNDPLSGKLLKMDLIDDIEELRQQLSEERINTDYLPKYGEHSDLATLKNIKHILLRKVRKQQSSSIVEDLLFMVLKGVESVFDGKTSVAGMRPNLKGLTKSVSLKMRNQKQQFSEAIEQFCQKRGISQNSKLLVQIGISAVKRNFLNKDQSQIEDRSEDLQLLQQMYKNNN